MQIDLFIRFWIKHLSFSNEVFLSLQVCEHLNALDSLSVGIQKISLMNSAFKWIVNLTLSPGFIMMRICSGVSELIGLLSGVLAIFSSVESAMSHINGWGNTERMFNGLHGSKSGCADQYVYMVWEGEWTPAKQKHNKVAFWAAINLGASGDQCPNAFLIGFHGVSKLPWRIWSSAREAQIKYCLGTACPRIDYYGLVSHCSGVHAPWRP